MSKALRIKIIDYLRRHDATVKYIDIKAHVLHDKDSVEQRDEFKATLDYLSNNKYIAINGSYEFLHWTMAQGLYNLGNKVIAAKLTPKGQNYQPEKGEDEMEAAVQPVLAVIKKSNEAKYERAYGAEAEEVTAEESYEADKTVEPKYYQPDEVSLPWYTETKPEVTEEPKLPWYEDVNPPEPVEEPKLPWYEDVKPTEPVEEPKLPWYEDVKHDDPVAEPKLPWYEDVNPAEPQPIPEPFEEKTEPKIYKFPPIDYKPENITRHPAPMVIEILNENLSQSLDAISNLKIKKPARLTGDFERDVNIILKFVLVVVLFLFFACIVWLYMG
ncbi:hypothetical protein [uncultured Mucilaginibacter sp.]|uniref:hypothetical protein n=1 Tax=uncultured Mucilaginibacter sp. TaxID=797541 RepID=UPI0025D2A863|nr:hypothetical protein [uncultured Mucilaginibacter sp.]